MDIRTNDFCSHMPLIKVKISHYRHADHKGRGVIASLFDLGTKLR
jgi:hypothetical protein